MSETTKPPEPPTPPDCDLRDFGWMPLDVLRLRDSELAVLASADAFRAAILLWCASWHQVPAASLPNDDRLLANLAGYGRDLDGWAAVRADALTGFVACADGRLYHPELSAKAIEADDKRRSQRKRTEAAVLARSRDRHHEQRHDERHDQRHEVQETGQDKTGTGQEYPSLRSVDDWPKDFRERFWAAYPRKVGKHLAARRLEGLRKAGKVTFADLMAGVERYAGACLQIETQFQKHPATWLNAGCWDDDAGALKRAAAPPRHGGGAQGFESILFDNSRLHDHSGVHDDTAPRASFDLDLRAARAT